MKSHNLCTKRKGWIIPSGMMSAALLLASFLIPTVVQAETPPGCVGNALNIGFFSTPSAIIDGQTVNYTVAVSNASPGCDVLNAEVSFACPPADGSIPAAAAAVVLASGVNFPADGSGDSTYDVTTNPAQLACVVDVNVGVTVARARAFIGDRANNPPTDLTKGALQTTPPQAFLTDKILPTTILDCEVKVDKQISCTGEPGTFFDIGAVINNEGGTLGPVCLDSDFIHVKYEAVNTGDTPLFGCVLDESNGQYGIEPILGIIPVAGTSGLLTAASQPLCQDALTGVEPDTIGVDCFCLENQAPGFITSALDEATLECVTPRVLVDKRLDCDGNGAADNFSADANGFQLADGDNFDATECTVPDGTPIRYQYQVSNDGAATLFDCELTDDNPLATPGALLPTGAGQVAGTILAGTNSANLPGTLVPLCGDALDNEEEDTATVLCCTKDIAGSVNDNCPTENKVTAYDRADLACITPSLDISKTCVDVAPQNGIDEITVSVTAGPVALTNCAVTTENLYKEDPACALGLGNETGPATPVALAPASLDVPVGGQADFTGLLASSLTAPACNEVQVTCDTPSGPLSDDSDAVCPGQGQGCLTRTPGFWATHPFLITDAPANDPRSLDLLDLEICGLVFDNTVAGVASNTGANTNSTTEAMCSVGTDGKLYQGKSQQAQLVRQCVAAELNVAATLEGGGDCLGDRPGLGDLIEGCCGVESICTGDVANGFNVGSCIDQLDAFNNSNDSIATFAPFNGPGPADPSYCQAAKGNGVITQP